MIGYIMSGLILAGFLVICFEEAQGCVSSDDWKIWAKTALSIFVLIAAVFVAGALVAVQR